MEDIERDRVYEFLREGLEENSGWYMKRFTVNSILPVDKYTLLHRFLADKELRINLRVNCLRIFLDENTKYFSFIQSTSNEQAIQSILILIMKNCPNIETIDFRNLLFTRRNITNFKNVLKSCKELKSLRVKCCDYNCQIRELLLDDFHNQTRNVQIGLQKIDYISGFDLTRSESMRLLKMLPNLKSFGKDQPLGRLLSSFTNNDNVLNRFMNITEIADENTNLTTLELFVKYCPNANRIYLFYPDRNVIENLSKFSLLTDLWIFSEYIDELMNLFSNKKIIARQIKTLHIYNPEHEYDSNILHGLCPELLLLDINHTEFRF